MLGEMQTDTILTYRTASVRMAKIHFTAASGRMHTSRYFVFTYT